MITDEQTLTGATSEYGTSYKVWDDGFGPLWVYRDASGLLGVVRAMSWEDAWDCAMDEILTPIPDDEVAEAYGFDGPAADEDMKQAARAAQASGTDYPELIEGYRYQSNATGSGIVSWDLNGESLNALTPARAEELGITIEVEDDE